MNADAQIQFVYGIGFINAILDDHARNGYTKAHIHAKLFLDNLFISWNR